MKRTLLLFSLFLASLIGTAQVDTVSIYDIQFVPQQDLQNCIDTSVYEGRQVHFVGVVSVDGNRSEVVSGSISGGHRPFLNVQDTANSGAGGPFLGVDVMGVIDGTSNPYPGFENLIAGDIIEVTGTVGSFDGETQITPVSSSAITVIGNQNAPSPIVVSVGDLNDANRENKLETGEQWEGSYVELQNVTVSAVNFFSGGSRVSMDVVDLNGNMINVSDRFVAQKLPSHSTVNPQSPFSTGNFTAPPVGTQYSHIRGFIVHSGNGCTGFGGRGYEINPAYDSDYQIGVAPPNITNITRDKVVPTSSDDVVISADISDFDGSITSATLKYSPNLSDPISAFTSVTMNNTSGDTYEGTIPAQADGSVVRYILEATDDAANTTVFPFTPSGASVDNVYHYTVRDNGLQIVDIQRTFGGSDLSSFNGDEVTFTGYVTASARDYDIGYVYVQQDGENEYAGVICVGSLDLLSLYRGEEVTITGFVEEDFGMTRVNVTSVTKAGGFKLLEPVSIDPSDATLELEPYESMLVQYVNPMGGSLYLNEPDLGFGDYGFGTTQGGSDNGRVLAGRQSGSSYSSLYVSVISDSFYIANDGQLEVAPVITNSSMTVDTLIGMLYYSFSNFRLQPRNNDDFIGFSEPLDSAQLEPFEPQDTSSVAEITKGAFNVYPNPTNGVLNIQMLDHVDTYQIDIYDLTGKHVFTRVSANPMQQVDVSFLSKGMYVIDLKTQDQRFIKREKIMVE